MSDRWLQLQLNKDEDHSWTNLFHWKQWWRLLHDNNDSKKSVKNAGESASCVSTNDFWWGPASYVYQTSTMTMRGTQRLIGASTEGVSWETDCNINRSNVNDIYSRHYIWEYLSCPAEHMVCWISVQCVYVTNDVCISFSLSTQFLCCSYSVWNPCILCVM